MDASRGKAKGLLVDACGYLFVFTFVVPILPLALIAYIRSLHH